MAQGDETIRRLAYDNSVNPRLLLAPEYESRWVRSQPVNTIQTDYPMGYQDYRAKGRLTIQNELGGHTAIPWILWMAHR
jgi:hypothetical protein